MQPKVVIAGVLQKQIIEDAEYKIILNDHFGRDVDENDYKFACEIYGIAPAIKPQFVPESSIVVSKESIQSAKAMTVQIVNGQIELGVSVLSNADITASSANWAPVKFTLDTQIGLSADGTKLVLPIPVAAQQGFMILQSGDAKAVPSDIMTDWPNSWSHKVIKLKDILGIHKEVNSETLTIVGLSVDSANGRVLLKVGAETTANVDPTVANFLNVTVRKGAEVTVKVKLDGELPAQGYFRAKIEE